jgi:hypothetical protein
MDLAGDPPTRVRSARRAAGASRRLPAGRWSRSRPARTGPRPASRRPPGVARGSVCVSLAGPAPGPFPGGLGHTGVVAYQFLVVAAMFARAYPRLHASSSAAAYGITPSTWPVMAVAAGPVNPLMTATAPQVAPCRRTRSHHPRAFDGERGGAAVAGRGGAARHVWRVRMSVEPVPGDRVKTTRTAIPRLKERVETHEDEVGPGSGPVLLGVGSVMRVWPPDRRDVLTVFRPDLSGQTNARVSDSF